MQACARGPARLLLATLAALANEQRLVEDLTTEQLPSATGLADRTGPYLSGAGVDPARVVWSPGPSGTFLFRELPKGAP